MCLAQTHVALCSCPPGLKGDPRVRCEMPSQKCRGDAECGPSAACDAGLCVSKCSSAETDCLPNEVCRANGRCARICSSSHQCGEGRGCIDRLCQPGCTTNSQCKSNQVCAGNQCLDPCKNRDNPCGDCASCETVDHEMQCSCPLGHAGDPFSSCFANNLRYVNSGLIVG